MTTTRTARTRNVPTWRMTREELARTWAAHHGVVGKTGGWIYGPDRKPIVHGWTALADYLVGRGIIREGMGIDWRASDRVGATALVRQARDARRYARTGR